MAIEGDHLFVCQQRLRIHNSPIPIYSILFRICCVYLDVHDVHKRLSKCLHVQYENL